ncbi:DNA (cytosine-5-)-methyltransferase [Nocardioides seonyuensis]|uniref:Cytosine-specific methyltransferase n=1 Tax=Nocardioides seonyuensis TaxID=2518371 RepID=A0A4P7ID33_9ACTN|nr:DNA (cytosine-5-)-methyltransferase [Nocardioides seonyuensis]QBX55055.1 DNA (cytosine-5-)-methyltransferase [Nocardioides seonyuensis]
MTASFTFADLFAGVGGFHAALGAMGGNLWFASEIDKNAKAVYDHNWVRPLRDGGSDDGAKKVEGDIVPLTDQGRMEVPPVDVLAAGFPCQPFSKSGFQRGMDETRGTLFWNIANVLKERSPSVVLLENVRNLAGPNHQDTWETILRNLRDLGYRVADKPAVFSPHLLPPHLGGRPQVRERVFILAHKVRPGVAKRGDDPIALPRPVDGWNPQSWDLRKHLLLPDDEIEHPERYILDKAEVDIINAWDTLLHQVAERLEPNERLPGFPIWANEFRTVEEAEDLIEAARLEGDEIPKWKADFYRKNAVFYERHRSVIDPWLPSIKGFTASRQKFEWQAQDHVPLDDTVMHFRPSGVRAKRPTYVPALVAITQTSIIGKRRRLTPREAARLQGLPDWFEFKQERADGSIVEQSDPASYKQMGNGVNVGAAYYVFREYVLTHKDEIAHFAPHLVEAVLASSPNPDEELEKPLHEARPLTVGPEGSSRGTLTAAAR